MPTVSEIEVEVQRTEAEAEAETTWVQRKHLASHRVYPQTTASAHHMHALLVDDGATASPRSTSSPANHAVAAALTQIALDVGAAVRPANCDLLMLHRTGRQ